MAAFFRTLKAGVIYFALVFGAGFVQGTVRTFWIVPRLGARTAELMEEPVMFVVIVFTSRWVVRRLSLPPTAGARLGAGFLALVFLLVTEFTLGIWLRGVPMGEYFARLDPVAGTVYCAMLGVFALMPLLVARR
jgi:hypothetical protein